MLHYEPARCHAISYEWLGVALIGCLENPVAIVPNVDGYKSIRRVYDRLEPNQGVMERMADPRVS